MFRFKSGTFQFVLLFIYIQNKQKTHERKRTVLEIFPYHHYTGIRLILFIKMSPFMGGILGACTIYIMVRKQMFYLTQEKTFQKKYYSHFTLDRSHHVLSCTFIIGCMVTDQ